MSATTSKARVHEGLPHPLGATWDGLGGILAIAGALMGPETRDVEMHLLDLPAGQALAGGAVAGE